MDPCPCTRCACTVPCPCTRRVNALYPTPAHVCMRCTLPLHTVCMRWTPAQCACAAPCPCTRCAYAEPCPCTPCACIRLHVVSPLQWQPCALDRGQKLRPQPHLSLNHPPRAQLILRTLLQHARGAHAARHEGGDSGSRKELEEEKEEEAREGKQGRRRRRRSKRSKQSQTADLLYNAQRCSPSPPRTPPGSAPPVPWAAPCSRRSRGRSA